MKALAFALVVLMPLSAFSAPKRFEGVIGLKTNSRDSSIISDGVKFDAVRSAFMKCVASGYKKCVWMNPQDSVKRKFKRFGSTGSSTFTAIVMNFDDYVKEDTKQQTFIGTADQVFYGEASQHEQYGLEMWALENALNACAFHGYQYCSITNVRISTSNEYVGNSFRRGDRYESRAVAGVVGFNLK